MAFALAVNDICSSAVFAALAASSEPPQLGIVTKISPTVVVWQDGREVTYTPSTLPDSVDAGLSKFVPDFGSSFLNKLVRPKTTGAYGAFGNIDNRADAICVLTGNVTNSVFTDHPIAVLRLVSNGLFVVLSQAEIEAVPGA
jgi:hypothetical protein